MRSAPPVQSSASSYITDVAYPAHFHRETMPVWLVAALTALGHRAPDLQQPFTWLELGCGTGLGVMVAAAAHPHGQFIGIDFSAREIAQAERMAREAGLSNVRFVCQDLLETARLADDMDAPDCDFVVTHGVYSWVGEPVRVAIDHIVGRRLRPGGVAYVAYASQPGAASFASAQKLLRMATRQHPGDSAARARAGFTRLQALAQAGAGYFVEHPSSQRILARMAQMDDAYLAHDFLNEEWQPLHVADMMARLEAAGCAFVGSATVLENLDAVSIPAGMQPVLAQWQREGADAATLETVRDLARNQSLRRDLYQKTHGADHRLTADAHRAALLAQRVMLLPGAPAVLKAEGALRLSTGIGPVEVAVSQVSPLLAALRAGPRSYAELARLPAYAGNPGFINSLLQVLAWAGWLHAVAPGDAAQMQACEATARRLQVILAKAGYPNLHPVAQAGTATSPVTEGLVSF